MTDEAGMPSKRDPYSNHGIKIVSLFARLLFSGEAHSLIDLSRFLSCSKQTVIKLAEEIRRSYGVEIEETLQGKKRYYRLKRPGNLKPALFFNDAEIAAMQMCKVFAEYLLGRQQVRQANQAIEKRLALRADGTNMRFSGWAAAFVQERQWSRDQKVEKLKDGAIRLTFTESSAPEVISWALFFGEEAQVMKPGWLVDEVVENLDQMRLNLDFAL